MLCSTVNLVDDGLVQLKCLNSIASVVAGGGYIVVVWTVLVHLVNPSVTVDQAISKDVTIAFINNQRAILMHHHAKAYEAKYSSLSIRWDMAARCSHILGKIIWIVGTSTQDMDIGALETDQ